MLAVNSVVARVLTNREQLTHVHTVRHTGILKVPLKDVVLGCSKRDKKSLNMVLLDCQTTKAKGHQALQSHSKGLIKVYRLHKVLTGDN